MERRGGTTLWRQIQTALAEEIAAGAFAPGERLPTEPELAQRFGVNRHTLRRAMAELAEQGLVRIEQGRGSFVQEHVLDYPIGRRTRFSTNVLAQHRRPGGQLLKAIELPAPKEVARELDLPQGASCILIEALGQVDGRPVSIGRHWFPRQRFPDMISVYGRVGSVSLALADYGIADYERRVTRITARLPEEPEATLLRQPRTRPVLVTEAVNVDREDRPVEYGETLFAADRTQLVVERPD
ncbi:transcriptional regulator, GntR family [Tistlia consotensis]|uniref:Transcriptional regulator, GntR family n=1 Tax=Tistlia consotensis USBA 355 TaxID=560819 RepID=A0A1Y6CNP8_9PROT|nr:phosphonate metabolism transcriptional regulator PhnF [Tistlia consotensis]SMF80421.1 transcriptional regulator, GntR family [Tistlia consotensis USBA 355]SNR62664.1 transcriptional regulator, GntR family [Tistlia consotensis]